MTSPQVSVIIPCYNYGNYLADAINSVLQQNVEAGMEIIVVDDGSSDKTATVAQGFGSSIRYIYQDNQGLSAARNTGLRVAKGGFVVFLDADDLLGKGNLNAHLETFRAQPDLDVSVCHSLQVYENQTQVYRWPLRAEHLDLHLCHSNVAPVHTFMLRSQTPQERIFFDSSLKACEDYDYWLRLAAAGKRFTTNPRTFVIYKKHGGSLTTLNTQQLAYDSAVHLKIGKLLETVPDFPRAGKHYGWLAYGAGCLGMACGMYPTNPLYARKLLEESANAILKSAACAPKKIGEDPHLLAAADYYAVSYIKQARQFDYKAPGPLKKAMAFLGRRYPSLADLKMEALNAKKTFFLSRIICSYEAVQPDINKIISSQIISSN